MKSYFLAAAILFQLTCALQSKLTRRNFAITTATSLVSLVPESSSSLTPPLSPTVQSKMSSKLLSPRPAIVAVIGYTGGVGGCLLSAMDRIGLKPFALVRSSTMQIDGSDDMPVDFTELGKRLLAAASKEGGTPIIADVTASSIPQEHYKDWLSQGISVCTANKGIFAGPESKYQELLTATKPPTRLLYETTVGAGLPVLGTISSLRESSHKILKIEGILSGTLAFVLGAVSGGKMTFSDAVLKAKDLGYTEPDPRLDLGGIDVARKAVILARLSGLTGIELTGLDVESLVPKPLQDCSVDEFMAGLSAYDNDFAARVASIEKNPGNRLHYAAKVDVVNKKITVAPMAVDASHPFNSAGPDNLVAITTDFYSPRPLVVQGAGAGGDVTATGVLADILECTRSM
jgi:homoserine dehydrogenase